MVRHFSARAQRTRAVLAQWLEVVFSGLQAGVRGLRFVGLQGSEALNSSIALSDWFDAKGFDLRMLL